jgi:ABC-type transport system substrate-binding protein
MPRPTDDGIHTFKIRDGVKFHDGSPLTSADVAASWNAIIRPPEGVSSARESYYIMVDNVEAPDAATVVFHLKFATGAFLPALADPYAWIYKKEIRVESGELPPVTALSLNVAQAGNIPVRIAMPTKADSAAPPASWIRTSRSAALTR